MSLLILKTFQIVIPIILLISFYVYFNKNSILKIRRNINKRFYENKGEDRLKGRIYILFSMPIFAALGILTTNNTIIILSITIFIITLLLYSLQFNEKTLYEHIQYKKNQYNTQKKDSQLFNIIAYLETSIQTMSDDNISIENIMPPIIISADKTLKPLFINYLLDYRERKTEEANKRFLIKYNSKYAQSIINIFSLIENKTKKEDILLEVDKEKELYTYQYNSTEITKNKILSSFYTIINFMIFLLLSAVFIQTLFYLISKNISII